MVSTRLSTRTAVMQLGGICVTTSFPAQKWVLLAFFDDDARNFVLLVAIDSNGMRTSFIAREGPR